MKRFTAIAQLMTFIGFFGFLAGLLMNDIPAAIISAILLMGGCTYLDW